MAVKVGSFQITADVIGTKIPVTGTGFLPDAVFLRWTGRNSAIDAGPSRGHLYEGFGYILNNGERGCMSSWAQNNSDPYSTGCGLWNSCGVVYQSGPGTTTGRADFDSMNADGFTLIIDEQFGAEITVSYTAVFGKRFNVIELTEPGAIGVQAYTGASFQPAFAMFLTADVAAYDTMVVDTRWGMGAASGTGADNNFTWSLYEDSAAGVATTESYCRRTECLSMVVAGNVNMRAKLNGFTADGFELDWLERAGARKVLAVVSDGRWYVGNDVTSAALGVPWSLSGFTWSPEGYMMISRHGTEDAIDTPAGSPDLDHGFSVGFATGPTERNVLYTRRNFDTNAGASRPVWLHEFDEVYGNVDHQAAPVLLGLADINAAFAIDDIELVMDDADPAAKFFGYIAIGPPITEFRESLVEYQHNSYQSRNAGRPIFHQRGGREVKLEQIQVDNWVFSGGASFPSPTKYENLLEDPNVFYIESLGVSEGQAEIETDREGFFESIMKRLGRG